MQQEDDLRGLARVMDFMRAISILFTVINVYWFCYSSLKDWGITIGVVDKILLNFQRTTGLFSTILWTKLFAVVFLVLSCIGTKGVKEEKITWTKIYCFLSVGFILFFLNWWLLDPCHQWQTQLFISPRLQQVSFVYWLQEYGCPVCSKAT